MTTGQKMISKPMQHWTRCALGAVTLLGLAAAAAQAQRANDAYRPPAEVPYEGSGPGRFGGVSGGGSDQGYTPAPPQGGAYGNSGPTYGNQGGGQAYNSSGSYGRNDGRGYAANNEDDGRSQPSESGYGQPYSAPGPNADQGPPPRYDRADQPNPTHGYYSQGEIADKGRGFFGSISQGLASAIEYTYQKAGRPNGYILGEDGGGAFFAGLRYGEGVLYTKDAGDHKMFWQGPSLGYDIGGEGSKVMVLVYNMSEPGEIYHRFGGVEGSTYLVGGVSVQFQKHDDVTLAVIRSGVGLRLGVNVGYLKYTRSPTWNPF